MNATARLDKCYLEIETARPRHPDVEHEAGRPVRQLVIETGLSRGKHLGLQAN